MGGLQNQLQQVQLERSALQSRLKTSQAEIDSLQQLRQWYHQQLALAQEARVRLQGEMANMQVSTERKPVLKSGSSNFLFFFFLLLASSPLGNCCSVSFPSISGHYSGESAVGKNS